MPRRFGAGKVGRGAGGEVGKGRNCVTGHMPGHPGQSAHGTQPETCPFCSQLSLLSIVSQVFWANSRCGGPNSGFANLT